MADTDEMAASMAANMPEVPVRRRRQADDTEAPKTIRVRMLRGYWPHNAKPERLKIMPGEEYDLPIEEARTVLRARIAERLTDDF